MSRTISINILEYSSTCRMRLSQKLWRPAGQNPHIWTSGLFPNGNLQKRPAKIPFQKSGRVTWSSRDVLPFCLPQDAAEQKRLIHQYSLPTQLQDPPSFNQLTLYIDHAQHRRSKVSLQMSLLAWKHSAFCLCIFAETRPLSNFTTCYKSRLRQAQKSSHTDILCWLLAEWI